MHSEAFKRVFFIAPTAVISEAQQTYQHVVVKSIIIPACVKSGRLLQKMHVFNLIKMTGNHTPRIKTGSDVISPLEELLKKGSIFTHVDK